MKKKHKKNYKPLVFLLLVIALIIVYIYYNPFLVLKLNGEKEIKVTLKEEYSDQGVIATFFGEKLDEIKVSSDINIEKSGTYYINYSVEKYFSKKNITRKVVVLDNIAPVLTFSSVGVTACPNDLDTNNYQAIDNIDGNITNKVKIKKDGEYLIYSVTDSSGNITSEKRKVTVIDNDKPVIILKGNKIINIKINDEYNEYGWTAIDNCDGDITTKVKSKSTINTNILGTYEVTYSVVDSANNKVTVSRTVNVLSTVELEGSYPEIDGYSKDIIGPTYIKGVLIVNKTYSLPSDYNPGVNSDASSALNNMQQAAKKDGLSIPTISGFRSYSTQKKIYENNLSTQGSSITNMVSARPGHSEHQTGLSFDIGEIKNSFGDTKAGKWLNLNCYKYGFIIRYPKNKSDITGYNYEPWHVRYVGIEIATKIYNQNITLEEYLEITK